MAVSWLGGVSDTENRDRICELNTLRSRIVGLSAELQASKAKTQEAQLAVAALEKQAHDAVAAPTAIRGHAPLATAADREHSVYGTLTKDFGYKQIYATKLDSLINNSLFPVWEKQRAYRESRAKRIATAMAKTNSPFPGVIAVYEMEGERAIIDGQHRVGALRILKEAGLWTGNTEILLEVHQVQSKTDVEALFVDINRAEPLSFVDRPGAVSDDAKAMLNEATQKLSKEYSAMFSDSRRCRSPHLNVEKLRDDIFESGIIERHKLNSTGALVAWLEEVNLALYMQRDRWDDRMRTPSFAKAFKKAKSHHFFLGLDNSWLDL